MAKTMQPMQENKKPVMYRRNGSGDLYVFDAVRYFEDTTATATGSRHKHYLREGAGRLSLDIPSNNNRRNNNSIPLQAMMMEDRNSIPLRAMVMDPNEPMMIKNQRKFKQPSSPGGKLAHFLNSLFNQTYSKKSKSKSTTSKQSVKDEDESPSGWRRKRMSSISLFRSGNSHTNNSNTTPIASDTKSAYDSRTQAPTKTNATYKDLRSYSDHKPACEITKIPINENHKNENLKIKSGGVSEKKRSSGNGLVEKVRVSDVKHDYDDDHHHQKYDPTVEIREFKRFIIDDDEDGDSDSSSDLFELTNYDLGYYSSGLPVFETTHMDNIRRGAPIVSS